MNTQDLREKGWTENLLGMEAELGSCVPDQFELVSHVANEIRKELCLYRTFPRPIGRFFLCTQDERVILRLASSLAQFLFADDGAVLHLNMREYSEKHMIPSLFGHSGGMIQAYFEGRLTGPIFDRPQTVVVLSHIEMMHPVGWQVLMPILAEGVYADGSGRIAEFDNTIFTLTTSLRGVTEIEAVFAREWLQLVLPIITIHSKQEICGQDGAAPAH